MLTFGVPQLDGERPSQRFFLGPQKTCKPDRNERSVPDPLLSPRSAINATVGGWTPKATDTGNRPARLLTSFLAGRRRSHHPRRCGGRRHQARHQRIPRLCLLWALLSEEPSAAAL